MRRAYLAVGFATLLILGLWQVRADQNSGAKKDHGSRPADLIMHGEYLVNRVAQCGDCRTPRNAKGEPEQSKLLQGSALAFIPKNKTEHWAEESPDITSSGLAGELSEEEMIKFFTTGKNAQGDKPTPPMPAFRLHEQDARTVTLYLKSLPGKKASGTSK